MKKSNVTKAVFMLLAAMMVFLMGCGSGKGEDDPNLGKYVAKSAEMSGFTVGVEDLFEGGFIIELKKNGKAHLEADGEDGGNIKWTLDGDKFHAEGGGAELDGTLSNGKMVLENVMDSGMTLYLECDEIISAASADNADKDKDEGGSETESKAGNFEDDNKETGDSGDDKSGGKKSMSGKIDDMLGSSSTSGKWILYNVNQNGKVYMEDELKDKGIEAWIEMNDDGSGTINLVGELMDMEWSDGKITVPDNGEGEREEYKYTISNEYLVLVDEGMVLTFIQEGASSSSDAGNDKGSDEGSEFYTADAEMSEELMERYEGDWHGLIILNTAQGDTYAQYEGKKSDVVARVCLDEKGNVTNMFLLSGMKGDPETVNFRNVTAELDPSFDGMYISGDFLENGSFDTEFASVEDGFFFVNLIVKADNGDSINATIGMRRLDDKWTDDDYPRYPDDSIAYFKGRDFDYILSYFTGAPKTIPSQTHVTDWDK